MAKRPKDTPKEVQDTVAPPPFEATGESGNYQHQNQAVQRPAVGVQPEFPSRRRPKQNATTHSWHRSCLGQRREGETCGVVAGTDRKTCATELHRLGSD